MSPDEDRRQQAAAHPEALGAAGAHPDDVIDATEDDYNDLDSVGDELVDPLGDPFGALLTGAGGGGGLDLGSLMEQASSMVAAQQEIAEREVEGVAGGGAVRVGVTGGFEFRSVTIEPSAVDPEDVEMLQDLVLAALHHAVDQIKELQAGSLNLGGTDLGGLLGS